MNGVEGLHRRRPELVEGFLDHDLPYFAWGSGPPLVYLRGFSTTNANPTGMQRSFEVRMMRSLSQQFHVHAVTRPAHLPADVTMADIATWHADAIFDRFDGPVHVLGVSSGGSVALQLAADHPQIVRRMVIAASGYRMSTSARIAQMRYVTSIAEGRRGAHYLARQKVSYTNSGTSPRRSDVAAGSSSSAERSIRHGRFRARRGRFRPEGSSRGDQRPPPGDRRRPRQRVSG